MWGLAILFMLVVGTHTVEAGHHWEQACILQSETNYRSYQPNDEGRSTDLQSGVSYDRAEIERNRVVHPLDIYVGYTPRGRPKQYCMRFEIHNAGDQNVSGVRWPFAKLAFGTLMANGNTGDRRAIVEDPTSDPEPDLHNSEIRIFANKPGEITSYMPQEKSAAPPRDQWGALEIYQLELAHLETAIAEQARAFAESQPDRKIERFEGMRLPGETFELQELNRRLSSGGLILGAQSRAEPTDDGGIKITNELRVEGDTGSSKVTAPYLLALQELGGNGNAEAIGGQYGDVIGFVEEAREHWLDLAGDGGSISVSQVWNPESDWSGTLPIVYHPVAISTELGIDCMLVPAYAPAPWPFLLDDCPPLQ